MSEAWLTSIRTQLQEIAGRLDGPGGAGRDAVKRDIITLFKRVDAALTDGRHDVMLFSSGGKAVRFEETDVRPMGRNAHGVRGTVEEIGIAERDVPGARGELDLADLLGVEADLLADEVARVE